MHSYQGYCRSQLDCLILFGAACMGLVPRVSQRLSEDERSEIKSGSIYIWDENEAGVKRWTDGKSWSTSRVSGPFLVYRELENNGLQSSSRCQVKPYGLCKQSASITMDDNTKLHLIAYYKKEDVRSGALMQPSMDMNFKDITTLLKKRNLGLVLPPDATSPPPRSPPALMQSKPSYPMMQYPVPVKMPIRHSSPPVAPVGVPTTHAGSPLHNQFAAPPLVAVGTPQSPPYMGMQTSPVIIPQVPQIRVPQLQQTYNSADQGFKGGAAVRVFDEDRRQLSLLDRYLPAY